MTRRPRVRLAPPMLALAIGLAILITSAARSAGQGISPGPVEIGSGPIRERSLGVTGRNVYHPDTVEMFGYLNRVIGLDSTLLYSDGAPSERTARFTYSGDVSLTSRADRGDVTAFDGVGVLRIYLDDVPDASWDDPESFADGQPIAEFSIRLRDTLHRQAPGVGVLVGDGELTQEAAAGFAMEGEEYRFGNAGIEQRVRYVGALVPGAAEPGSFAVSLTGAVNVVVREAIPVNVGRTATTAATPAPDNCPDLQPWLDQTVDSLSQAPAIVALLGAEDDLASLDEDEVRRAAVEMGSLQATQRGIMAPEAAAEANRLVVTALSTYARGLEVIATAAAERDADLLAQGNAVIADGSQLLERAVDDVSALANTCVGTQASDQEPG